MQASESWLQCMDQLAAKLQTWNFWGAVSYRPSAFAFLHFDFANTIALSLLYYIKLLKRI